MFGLFKTRDQKFWEWFALHERTLFDVDVSNEVQREGTFSELTAALRSVSPDLTFEIGPKIDGKRELVLSAGGIKSAFATVEALANSAPSLERWSITKFRPRRSPVMTISFGEITVNPERVEFTILSNGKELGIYLFFEGYSESAANTWGQIGYLLLDEALGEYDVEMKVGLIKFFPFGAHEEAPRFPLTELAAKFDEHFAQLRH